MKENLLPPSLSNPKYRGKSYTQWMYEYYQDLANYETAVNLQQINETLSQLQNNNIVNTNTNTDFNNDYEYTKLDDDQDIYTETDIKNSLKIMKNKHNKYYKQTNVIYQKILSLQNSISTMRTKYTIRGIICIIISILFVIYTFNSELLQDNAVLFLLAETMIIPAIILITEQIKDMKETNIYTQISSIRSELRAYLKLAETESIKINRENKKNKSKEKSKEILQVKNNKIRD